MNAKNPITIDDFLYASPSSRDDERYIYCKECFAVYEPYFARPASWEDTQDSFWMECEYCPTHVERPQEPTRKLPHSPVVYVICDECYSVSHYTYSASLLPMPHSQPPYRVRCDFCGEFKPYQVKETNPYHERFVEAPNMLKLIQSHGISCHVTLIGMIRAMDAYTYRDDNNDIAIGFDWVLLNPTLINDIYEFLGY